MYVVRTPHVDLSPYVDQYWFVSSKPGQTTQLSVDVYVDGRADMVINYGVPYSRVVSGVPSWVDYSNVDGQRTRPVQIRQRGRVQICGVRLHPGGLSAFTSRPVSELTDIVVPIREVIPAFDGLTTTRLSEAAADPDAQRAIIDATLRSVLVCTPDDRTHITNIRRLNRNPPATVRELSDRLHMSIRTAERTFRRIVGVTPKFYLRIARFQSALRRLMDEPASDLAELAQACGYYDQSHLVREFHALAGGVPREYKGYMPPELRDFAPNVVRYGPESGGQASDYRSGGGRNQ